ncbi:hypothetical protein PVAG01_05926 [Phlyctema vagabunda]|uniref:Uncharacterized protein n=1 Tax=Phlyctema vagabunda TaxID=108571 RepID=A0ABR4PEM6_9HELO
MFGPHHTEAEETEHTREMSRNQMEGQATRYDTCIYSCNESEGGDQLNAIRNASSAGARNRIEGSTCRTRLQRRQSSPTLPLERDDHAEEAGEKDNIELADGNIRSTEYVAYRSIDGEVDDDRGLNSNAATNMRSCSRVVLKLFDLNLVRKRTDPYQGPVPKLETWIELTDGRPKEMAACDLDDIENMTYEDLLSGGARLYHGITALGQLRRSLAKNWPSSCIKELQSHLSSNGLTIWRMHFVESLDLINRVAWEVHKLRKEHVELQLDLDASRQELEEARVQNQDLQLKLEQKEVVNQQIVSNARAEAVYRKARQNLLARLFQLYEKHKNDITAPASEGNEDSVREDRWHRIAESLMDEICSLDAKRQAEWRQFIGCVEGLDQREKTRMKKQRESRIVKDREWRGISCKPEYEFLMTALDPKECVRGSVDDGEEKYDRCRVGREPDQRFMVLRSPLGRAIKHMARRRRM